MSRPGPSPTTLVVGVSPRFALVCREAAERAGSTYIGASLAEAPGVVARERPEVVLVTEDVYCFDPERFDALADGVSAELVIAGSEDEVMTRVARRIVRAVLGATQRRRGTEARPTVPAPATPVPTARIQVRRDWDDEDTPISFAGGVAAPSLRSAITAPPSFGSAVTAPPSLGSAVTAPRSFGPARTSPPTAEAALLEASFTARELHDAAPDIEVDEIEDIDLEAISGDALEATPAAISAPISSDPSLRPVSGVRDRRAPKPTTQFSRVTAGRKP